MLWRAPPDGDVFNAMRPKPSTCIHCCTPHVSPSSVASCSCEMAAAPNCRQVRRACSDSVSSPDDDGTDNATAFPGNALSGAGGGFDSALRRSRASTLSAAAKRTSFVDAWKNAAAGRQPLSHVEYER